MTHPQVQDGPVEGPAGTPEHHHHHLSVHDVTPAHPAGAGVIKPGYHPRLTNEDLAPLKKKTWGSYNFFAFWMSDVHSVGGYITAGSLFALGLAAWQVLVALVVASPSSTSCATWWPGPPRRPAPPTRWRPASRSACSAPTSRPSSGD